MLATLLVRPAASIALGAICALLVAVQGVAPAFAQSFPSRPVTLVVAFAPGGPTDQIARLVAQKMSGNLGQSVLVDNRPGGGGQVAAGVVKIAKPDGYTLFVGATEMFAINPTLFRKFSYDPLVDFKPVAALAGTPMILVVPVDSPARTVQDLFSLARDRQGGLTFASQGLGSIGHLLGQTLGSRASAPLTHVPYKGSAPALQDLTTGRVDMMFDVAMSSGPWISNGRLRALAVAAPETMPSLEGTPTLAAAGVQGLDAGVWFGIVAPAGTPDAITDTLNRAVVAALSSPDVVQRLNDQGLKTMPMTTKEFGNFMKAELDRWTPVVKESGAVVE